jgi:acyl-coenzyme A synthetase/AMP-(fatty) acid ligase
MLAAAGRPRILVTTPVHLRALIRSELSLPPLDFLVSATSPLDDALAGICEQRFEAPLLEIYGCTEAGSLAGRRPVQTDSWCLFESLELQQESVQAHAVVAPYLPAPVLLNDTLSIIDEQHFTLEGRSSDLINIAGKRTSLSALNHGLLAIPGVEDGAFFLPDDTEMGTTRLVVFVVAPTLSSDALLQALRTELDPAFLPRAVHKLDRLPRNETGKLPRKVLQDLLNNS